MKRISRGGRLFLFGIAMATILPVTADVNGAGTAAPIHFAGDGHTACRFFPPNRMRFPIRPTGQITQPQVDRILQVMQQIYAPIFQRMGRSQLKIASRWADDEVNAGAIVCNRPDLMGTPGYPPECAGAQRTPTVNIPISLVVLHGGLARHPFMTQEGLVLVACHEIGHHLGGYPRYDRNRDWASTEGQSDYYATSKCARRVFAAMGRNAFWASRAPIPLEVRTACVASFPGSPEDQAICMRSSLGGLALARVLATASGGDARAITFANHDRTQVPVTFEGHPQALCRLDTYVAGAICQVPQAEEFSATDARSGACHPQRLQSRGARPGCWFAGR